MNGVFVLVTLTIFAGKEGKLRSEGQEREGLLDKMESGLVTSHRHPVRIYLLIMVDDSNDLRICTLGGGRLSVM